MVNPRVASRILLLACGVGLALLMGGCAAKEQQARPRFFWPPPPVEPRIEYIDFYRVEEDLDKGPGSWLVEVVLGKEQPAPLLRSPADVASDGKGRVVVTDLTARQAFVFDYNAKKVRSLRDRDGQDMYMQSPLGVTTDDRGWIYVADVNARRVLVFDEREQLKNIIGNDQLLHPTAVAVNRTLGQLFVTDPWSHQIVVFDVQGNELRRIGQRGVRDGEFNYPVDIDIDSDGRLYVLDAMNARVQVLDSEGNFLRKFGERGTATGSFQIPKGIALSPSGQVYVTDGLAHKMVIFSAEGEFLLALGAREIFIEGTVSPGGFYMPRGVDVDNNDAIWVVDSLNNMFHQFQYLTADYLRANPIRSGQVYREEHY